jgi:hypothetical protein
MAQVDTHTQVAHLLIPVDLVVVDNAITLQGPQEHLVKVMLVGMVLALVVAVAVRQQAVQIMLTMP